LLKVKTPFTTHINNDENNVWVVQNLSNQNKNPSKNVNSYLCWADSARCMLDELAKKSI